MLSKILVIPSQLVSLLNLVKNGTYARMDESHLLLWVYSLIPRLKHTSSVGYVYDDEMTLHANPNGQHPENPGRIKHIKKMLEESGLLQYCIEIPCREATHDEIDIVHSPSYWKKMNKVEKNTSMTLEQLKEFSITEFNSVYLNKSSFKCARLAAGGVIESVFAVLNGICNSCISIVRPPGHHAEAHCAMGFCLYNNVAVATKVAIQQKLASKILIVDWDIHHGNGTQRMFWNDSNVLYFSVHRYDRGKFYPGDAGGAPHRVGVGEGKGKTVNIAWNGKGMGDQEYYAVWDNILMPIAKEYQPDIVIVSAGFDAAQGDPLGGCNVTPQGYAELTRKLMQLANGRIVLALEGGYNLNSISNSCVACVRSMLHAKNTKPKHKHVPVHTVMPKAQDAINATLKYQTPYWKFL